MKKIALAILALMLTATPVYADDFLDLFEDGQRQAFEKWKPLAEQGDAEAQFHLGEKYDTGLGVTQDDKEAVKWYRLSAEQGYAKAQ